MSSMPPYIEPYVKVARRPQELISSPSIVDLTLATSPIVFYPLNESSGTDALDVSGSGYHATYTNVSVGSDTFVDGTPSSVWNTGDTVNSQVYIGDSGYRDDMNASAGSVAFWVKAHEWTANYGAIFEAPFSPTWTFRKSSNGSNFEFIINGNQWNYSHGNRLDWWHACVTWDIAEDIQRYYIDGVQTATDTGLNDMSNFATSAVQTIGRYSNSYHWDGSIRNFAIWDKVLTPEEIQNNLITPEYL